MGLGILPKKKNLPKSHMRKRADFMEKGTLFLCLLRNLFFFLQGITAFYILLWKIITV